MTTNLTCLANMSFSISRRVFKFNCRRSLTAAVRTAAMRDGSDGGGLVDESMVVLRKRIREARMAEANYEPPPHWAEWEKQYYCARYGSDVLEAVRVLQTFLMSTRPAVAVGVAALLTASVPAAAVLIWLRLAEAVGPALPGLH